MAHSAQDDRLDALPSDEAREAVVGDAACVQHATAQGLAWYEAGRTHGSGVHAVLVKQQVQREHHAQQDRKPSEWATSPLVCATMRSAWSVPPMASRAFLPDGVPGGVVQDRDGLRTGKVRDGLRRHGRSFRNAGDDGGAHGLNSPPTNAVSAASAKVTAVMARMTQMGRRVFATSALFERGNHRDSSAAAMKFSRYASTRRWPGAQGRTRRLRRWSIGRRIGRRLAPPRQGRQ